MVKILVPNTYSTLYTSCENDKCLMKSMLIRSEPGKKIRIDELTLSMFSMAANVTGIVWIVAKVDGVLTELVQWTSGSTVSVPLSATPVFEAPLGKDVTLEWRLLTSDAATRVKINNLTYSYTMVENEAVVPQCLVVVECGTETEAETLAKTLTDQGANIYIRKIILT